MNVKQEITDIKQNFDQDKHLIFGYTPMCGTCKVSERMLDIANEILQLPLVKADLNFHPDFSEACLLYTSPSPRDRG